MIVLYRYMYLAVKLIMRGQGFMWTPNRLWTKPKCMDLIESHTLKLTPCQWWRLTYLWTVWCACVDNFYCITDTLLGGHRDVKVVSFIHVKLKSELTI